MEHERGSEGAREEGPREGGRDGRGCLEAYASAWLATAARFAADTLRACLDCPAAGLRGWAASASAAAGDEAPHVRVGPARWYPPAREKRGRLFEWLGVTPDCMAKSRTDGETEEAGSKGKRGREDRKGCLSSDLRLLLLRRIAMTDISSSRIILGQA
jgi:hypothetical protein